MRAVFVILLGALALEGRQPFFDRTHPSKIFGEDRNYRIFLPPDYDTAGHHYPVIYYFHGHSDRFTLEHYDNGTDTVPKIAAFVAANPVIVVAADGYVARDYTGFYGGSPYDVRAEGGDFDYGEYFLELVAHVDSTYRTLTDRRHRATTGLSMGGFMSLFLSARYPDLIGSASSFNPGPEFYLGPKGRRLLWAPKDHIANHERTMVRLIRASGDYISQYHEETREAYARAHEVDFEYRIDEYHKHWATSIGETFAFHNRAFANSALNNVPERWSYSSAYPSFTVRGWRVRADLPQAAFICLQDVTQGGFRLTTRRWAPDGPPAGGTVAVYTAPHYVPGRSYRLQILDLDTGVTSRTETVAGPKGSLTIQVPASGAQVSVSGPGAAMQPPVLLPVSHSHQPIVPSPLSIRIFNPRTTPMTQVKVALSSEYPTVQVESGAAAVERIEPGAFADISDRFRIRYTQGGGYFAPARLVLRITYDGWHSEIGNIDVRIAPDAPPSPAAIELLDGRTVTIPVFRQKGNQGGGGSIQRTVTEGKGNGNGKLEPGEEATIWVKLSQGLDPFDKNNWYRARIYSSSPQLVEIVRIEEQKQLEWTSAKERTSLVRLSADSPASRSLELLLDNESWSYHFTPDVRYGREKLYQAFQFHQHHIHRVTLP